MRTVKIMIAALAVTSLSGPALAGDDKSSGTTYTYSSKGFGSLLWGKKPSKGSSSSSGGSTSSGGSSGGYTGSSGGTSSGGSSSGGASGGAPTPVPEPATIALMGAGLGMLALRRRRRKG